MKNRFHIGVIVVLIALVVVLWLGSWWAITNFVVSSDTNNLTDQAARGVFGDQFGAVNALFSGLAFTGVITTLILQQAEIKKQARTLQRQQFESGFFHLLDLHTKIIDQLDIGGSKGRVAFERFLKTMEARSDSLSAMVALKPLSRIQVSDIASNRKVSEECKLLLGPTATLQIEEILKKESGSGIVALFNDDNKEEHLRIITDAYYLAHKDTNHGMAHYFRTLYHIVKYIDDSSLINDDEKNRFARIISAQLSEDEQTAIFYNSMIVPRTVGGISVDFGFPKMHKLLIKYSLLNNLSPDRLFHKMHKDVFENLKTKQNA
jgi:hypothetical protein